MFKKSFKLRVFSISERLLLKIYIAYIILLPIIFIQRYAFDLHVAGAHFTFNYFFIVVAITVLATFLRYFADSNSRKDLIKLATEFLKGFRIIMLAIIGLVISDFLSFYKAWRANKIVREAMALGKVSVLMHVNSAGHILSTGLATLIKHFIVYFLFIFTSWVWFYIFAKYRGTESLKINSETSLKKHTQLNYLFDKLIKMFVIIAILNILASVAQILDCWFNKCAFINWLQQFFTSTALPPTNQVFAYFQPGEVRQHLLLRPQGIFGDTNFSGMFLVLSSILFFIKSVFVNNRPVKKTGNTKSSNIKASWGYAFLSIISIFLFILTFSRSALIGIFIFIPFLIVLIRVYSKQILNFIGVVVLSIVVFMGILFTVYPNSKTFILRRLNIGKDPSALTHKELYEESKIIIAKHKPGLIGNGLGTYDFLYDITIKNKPKPQNPHSIWIKIFIEQGVLGVIALTVFGGALLVNLNNGYMPLFKLIKEYDFRKKRKIAYDLELLVYSQFFNSWILYFLMVGLVYYGFYMPFVWGFGIIPAYVDN